MEIDDRPNCDHRRSKRRIRRLYHEQGRSPCNGVEQREKTSTLRDELETLETQFEAIKTEKEEVAETFKAKDAQLRELSKDVIQVSS